MMKRKRKHYSSIGTHIWVSTGVWNESYGWIIKYGIALMWTLKKSTEILKYSNICFIVIHHEQKRDHEFNGSIHTSIIFVPFKTHGRNISLTRNVDFETALLRLVFWHSFDVLKNVQVWVLRW